MTLHLSHFPSNILSNQKQSYIEFHHFTGYSDVTEILKSWLLKLRKLDNCWSEVKWSYRPPFTVSKMWSLKFFSLAIYIYIYIYNIRPHYMDAQLYNCEDSLCRTVVYSTARCLPRYLQWAVTSSGGCQHEEHQDRIRLHLPGPSGAWLCGAQAEHRPTLACWQLDHSIKT